MPPPERTSAVLDANLYNNGLERMDFDPTKYGPEVARILAVDGNGQRCAPLVCGPCNASPDVQRALAAHQPAELFPEVREPEAPLAGLWLYFSCFEEAHRLIDDPKTREGEFWHAILHRREPDAGNAAYWFRRVGQHPVFPKLAAATKEILKSYPDAEFGAGNWDPFAFVNFCERARQQPGSAQEQAALEIQRAEWQLLFDYSARPQ
jgi:hypothetical protein